MERAALARTILRYPGVTVKNHPVMRLEVYIDWRNAHFPGEPTYVGKGLDLRSVYYTGNPQLLAAFKSMLADGYFQDNVAASLRPGKRPDFVGLLHLPQRYTEIQRKLKDIEPSMPMRGKDFVFTDEEIGVVALKNGTDVFFAELFWRANRGINNLAKIHYLTPEAEQIATIHQEQEFIPSGKYSTEPDWVVYGFRGNRFRYPGGYYRQLKAGMKIPMAERTGLPSHASCTSKRKAGITATAWTSCRRTFSTTSGPGAACAARPPSTPRSTASGSRPGANRTTR